MCLVLQLLLSQTLHLGDLCLFCAHYFWLCWVFLCRVFSACSEQGLLPGSGSRALGVRASIVVAHGLSSPFACGFFSDQGLNLCLLHWEAILNHETTREVRGNS